MTSQKTRCAHSPLLKSPKVIKTVQVEIINKDMQRIGGYLDTTLSTCVIWKKIRVKILSK